MKEDIFNKMKNDLMKMLDLEFNSLINTENDKKDILIVKNILHQYTFSNRLQQKGRLSRTIIDSLNLSYQLGDLFIKFDQNIS